MLERAWRLDPKDASQTEGCDEPVDEIEDVAEPLDESVDEEANDARNYCDIFGQLPKMAFGPTLVLLSMQGGLYLL